MSGEAPSQVDAAVGVVARRDGALLMVRRGHGPAGGTWSVPGGRIEPGETAMEAVVRELAEETGLEGLCGPLIGWAEIITDEHHAVVLDFEVTVVDDREARAGSDASEVEWVPLGEVAQRRLAPGLGEFLAEHGVIDVLD